MKTYLCQWGNCEQTTPVVRVAFKDRRVVFCCEAHAAMWLLDYAKGYRNLSMKDLDRIQALMERAK